MLCSANPLSSGPRAHTVVWEASIDVTEPLGLLGLASYIVISLWGQQRLFSLSLFEVITLLEQRVWLPFSGLELLFILK